MKKQFKVLTLILSLSNEAYTCCRDMSESYFRYQDIAQLKSSIWTDKSLGSFYKGQCYVDDRRYGGFDSNMTVVDTSETELMNPNYGINFNSNVRNSLSGSSFKVRKTMMRSELSGVGVDALGHKADIVITRSEVYPNSLIVRLKANGIKMICRLD